METRQKTKGPSKRERSRTRKGLFIEMLCCRVMRRPRRHSDILAPPGHLMLPFQAYRETSAPIMPSRSMRPSIAAAENTRGNKPDALV